MCALVSLHARSSSCFPQCAVTRYAPQVPDLASAQDITNDVAMATPCPLGQRSVRRSEKNPQGASWGLRNENIDRLVGLEALEGGQSNQRAFS